MQWKLVARLAVVFLALSYCTACGNTLSASDCATTEAFIDGKCVEINDRVGLHADDWTHVPEAWLCLLKTYSNNDGCDCGCGAVDPDCNVPGMRIIGCSETQVCNDTGTCVEVASIEEPPTDWICDADAYGSGDACDCECGAIDPDCSTGAVTTVANCDAYEAPRCDRYGKCVEAPTVDVAWTCAPQWYGDGAICDCDCGAFDPDCDAEDARVINCVRGSYVCSDQGQCVEQQVPNEWIQAGCNPLYYGAHDGCDCDCGGVVDPDCALSTALVNFGCDNPDLVCSEAGTCVAREVPLWTCGDEVNPGNHYNQVDGCDCGCGLYDPDCNLADAQVYGCGEGETCSQSGTCFNPELPDAWTCDVVYYATHDGCDGGCGAPDPDCIQEDGQYRDTADYDRCGDGLSAVVSTGGCVE